ncbi:hypothetical protein ACMFFK_20800 [Serratia marcescens]|uniref:hypothetical protein n=1 Tax=Serratia marcescens TaxID=615 RepID=UPI0015D71411|nr:hypothetical protein [Serratia marcescens]MCX2170618.1 hypothetical protein [Serratia marcescens]MCX2176852.1 hypothetical protein [Serratia marcescens]QLJ62161.1 hypothetical protein HP475_20580 [Serratia marcescens]
MDKLREEFEDAWIADNSSTPEEAEIRREALRKIWHINESGEGAYFDSFVMWAWKWWQASRGSLVVELPKPHAHLIWIQAGYAPDDYWDDVEVSRSEKDKCCDGSDRYPVYAEHEIAESLRSIGLSIKGDRV